MNFELLFFLYYFISLYIIIIFAIYTLKLYKKLKDAEKIIEDLKSHSKIEEEDIDDLIKEGNK